jgi:molybdate transport system substrate-binding protein
MDRLVRNARGANVDARHGLRRGRGAAMLRRDIRPQDDRTAAMPFALLRRLAICALAALVLAPSPTRAEDALVAVAANFADVARFLAAEYGAKTGHRVTITTGSTGKLYAQIVAGAPYDALLAADQASPERLEAEGRAVPGSRFTYASGRLALWSADPRLIDEDGAATLRAAAFRHIAIANPDLAPYGLAARQVLERLGLWDALADKLAMGQNIGQTHALIATGAAELGFVAYSQVHTGVAGSVWLTPDDLHDPIRQDAVLLWHGAENPAAVGFLDYLNNGPARDYIRSLGYGTL